MKMFIGLSLLALLFVIGSALAVSAIGRNAPPRRGNKQQEDEKK
jgi:hypothetical protein